MTTTPATSIGKLLTLACAVNLFGDLKAAYPDINAEQGFNFDPQATIRNT